MKVPYRIAGVAFGILSLTASFAGEFSIAAISGGSSVLIFIMIDILEELRK